MNKSFFSYLMILSLLALIISSCKVTQTYQAPAVSTAGLYRNSAFSDTHSIANMRYTEVFTDPALQRLISEGIAKSLDLKIAYTRVQQAQSYYVQSGAAFYPTLNASAQVTESKLSQVQGFGIRSS